MINDVRHHGFIDDASFYFLLQIYFSFALFTIICIYICEPHHHLNLG